MGGLVWGVFGNFNMIKIYKFFTGRLRDSVIFEAFSGQAKTEQEELMFNLFTLISLE